MTKNKLVVACLAALSAFAMTGCGDPKCDPECGAGFTCNTEVDPPACEATSACNPPCASGQTCDTTKNPAVCVTPSSSCSPSCGAGYHCDTSGAAPTCVANACTPACAANQRCDTRTNPGTCVDKVPCDPGCPAGSQCVNDQCECLGADGTGCTEDQTCKLTSIPAECVEICNAPKGCEPEWETCNHDTKQCEPNSCNTTAGVVQCEFGQACVAFEEGVQTGDCTCLPADYNDGVDSCALYGKVCDMDVDAPAPAGCVMPREYDSCQTAVGCAQGLDCVDFGDGDPMCLRPCATAGAAACDVSDFCIDNPNAGAADKHCYFNICAWPLDGAAERAAYFKPCYTGMPTETEDQSTWTGFCLPVQGPSNTDAGLCFQAGTAPSHGECDPNADRSNLAGICPKNQLCDGVEPGTAAGKTRGVCVEMCNGAPTPATNATKDCSAGVEGLNTCFDVSGLAGTNIATSARLGFCLAGCDPYAATSNCPQDALGNNQGCWFGPEMNNEGYCKAVTDGAVALGAECEWPTDERDSRSPCLAGICIGPNNGTSYCQQFCNTVTCPMGTDENNPTLCSTGCDASEFCLDYFEVTEPNQYLGFCFPAPTTAK